MMLRSLRKQWPTLVLFILTILFLCVKIKTFFNYYDEGFAMFGATRILYGDAPYRDFWAIYPPGQFYLLATLIKLFGSNLMVSRVFDVLTRFMMVVSVYLISRRLARSWWVYLPPFVAAMLLSAAGFYSYAIFPAMTLGLWAIWSWLKYTESDNHKWLVIAGGLLGITACIRWDLGAYAALSLLAGFYLFLYLPSFWPAAPEGTVNQPIHVRPGWRGLFLPVKRLLWVVVPMAVVAATFYCVIGLISGWNNLVSQVFYFPTFVLHSVRWLPYPSLVPTDLVKMVTYYDWQIPVLNLPSQDWFRFYLPILTLAIIVVYLVFTGIKLKGRLPSSSYLISVLLFYGGLLFNQALSRYDLIHVIPASIVVFSGAVAIFQQASGVAGRKWITHTFLGLVIVLGLLYFAPSLQELLNTLDSTPPWGCYSSLPIAGCVSISDDERQAAQFIQDNTQPGEKIFVGNTHHDRIFVNDIGLYYLSGRDSGTRYHELYPGVATTLAVQKDIVDQLEQNKVKLVVLVDVGNPNEPNGSAVSSGVTYLDSYIHSHFSYFGNFGSYTAYLKIP